MPLLLLLLAIPVGEVFIFLEVGSVIGTWPTIGLIVGTAVVGGMILRWQGLQTLARARQQLAANRLPVAEMAEGAALALAAVLLLTPGFFTDALGTLLLLPPLRRSLLRRLLARFAPHARHAGSDAGPASAAAGAGNAQGAQETRPQLGIQTQYVKDLSFENPSALERPPEAERSPQITVNVQVEARRLNQQTFEVVLQITAHASHEEKPVFLVELSYAGVFNFIDIPENAMEPALLIECPRLLFPFARRIVADVTRDGGFPPLLLAPIDFLALYRNRQQQAAQAQASEAVGAEARPPEAEPTFVEPAGVVPTVDGGGGD